MSLILKQEPANTIATPPAGKSTLFITDNSVMAIKTPAGTVTQFPTVQGSNTQVFFNDDGAINGSANLAFVKTTNTLTLTNGNVVATGVKTDNLYYANGNPWDLDQPAGSNTQLQFNNNGSFGASANLTFNGTTLLVGAAALQTDFPNATVIISQANTGQTHSENIGVIGEAVADSGNTSTWGIGVLGEARANGATKATGVQGGGYVTSSTDSGAAVGVRGYSIQTHSGGYNIGVLGNAAGSGLGNYAFYVQAGNIGSIETATTWDLTDNSIAALTFQSTGKANIFGIETTDGAEGIYTQGYLNVTGNITATAGIKTDNYYYANGSPVDFQQAGGSNTQIQFNDSDAFGGSAAFTFDKTTNVVTISNSLSVTANANVGNLNSGGNITASSASNVTFGDSTTLYSGYTTMNPVGVFHNTTSGAGTLQVASGSLANGIAIWTNNAANSFIESTGGIEFITGSTLRANLNPTSGTTQMALTATGLSVANTVSANIVNSSTTMNAIGNINAGNFVTTGNIQAGGTIYSNTSISTIGTITSGGNMFSNANLGCEVALYVGNGAGLVSGLDNPLVLTTGTGTKYVQAAIINKNANGSADWIAYGNNGNSVAGWMDMGFTGATFSDANYTITGNNDGYIFSKAVGGANLGGNLVVATGSTGTTNDIVFATGGFLTANEKMRFINATNQFYVEPTTVSTSTTTGALRVGGGVGIAGNIYAGALINAVGNIAGGNLSTAGTANVGNLNVTGNVTSALLPSANVTYDLGSDTQRWRDIYLSNSSIYLGNARLSGNGNSVVSTGNLTGANISTAGTLSVTGNANVGNLGTSGLIVATGNITSSANVVTDLIAGRTSGVTITAAGTNQNINLVPTGIGTVNVGNFIISNLGVPVADTDAATKKYVDDVSQGLNIHDSCQAATPTTLATITGGTITYNNGASGVGANLTTTGSFNLIDGVNVQTSGTRILVKNEANAVYNGIYTWSNATVITRATDFNSVPEVEAGDFVFISGGTLYDNTGWVQTDSPTAIGTAGNTITFTQFSGAGTYTAGTGLTLTGSQFSITNTTVTAGAYGNGDSVASFTVNGQGQLTAAANVVITANAANLSGTVLKSTVVTSSLTSVGTLGSLTVTGNISAGNVSATTFTGALSGAATTAGTVTTAAQPNITSVGTLTSLAVTGNISAGNVSATTFTGALSGAATTAGTVTSAAQPNITSVGTLSGLTVSSTISGSVSGTAATVTTAAQPNITSVGTLTSLAVTGNISGANVTATHYGAATGLTGIPGANVTGTVPSATTAGTVTTAAQPNITSVGTLTSLTLSGTLTGAVQIGTGAATFNGTTLTTGANTTAGTVTGDWTLSAGSKLNATYADLAEKYVADADYEPGTVLVFGGEHEVTLSNDFDSTRVAGVVTTNPAYTMNNGCDGEYVATIALQGRVPVKVIGPVFKGDLLVSCGNGHAIANNIARAGTIVGKSLENFSEATGIIEVAVGRF